MMGDVPLGRLRIIVIANSRKVPLLPDAPINQRDLVLREFGERVAREIRKDGVRMFARITDHLGHRRFFPSIVNLVMAFGARLRTGVVRRSGGGLLLGLLSAGKRAKTADEQQQFPAFLVGFVVRIAPRRHTRESHALLDDVVDLPVRKVLRLGRAQIGRLRIEIAADRGHAGAIRTVTNGAAREEMIATFLQVFRSRFPWICFFACAPRNGEISHGARH